MLIGIPESSVPSERKRLLKVLPMKHALEVSKSKYAAASYLGISVKTLRKAIKLHPELEKFRDVVPQAFSHMTPKQAENSKRRQKIYPDE